MPVFLIIPDFGLFAKELEFLESTFPILKLIKSLSNGGTLAPWAQILREKYQNSCPAAYGGKGVLLN